MLKRDCGRCWVATDRQGGGFELEPIARRAARNVAGMTGHPVDVQEWTQDALLWCITHPERVQRCTDTDALGWELVGHLLRRVDVEKAAQGTTHDEPTPAPTGGRGGGGILRRLPAVWLHDWTPPSSDPPGMPRSPVDVHSSMNPTVDRLALAQAVTGLPARHRVALGLRVVAGFTVAEVGERLGVSRQRAHQVLVEAATAVLVFVEGRSIELAGDGVEDHEVHEVPGDDS